jgi:toxin ParE1/3/4
VANRFRKAPQADHDLDSIWDFIASDSVRAADKQIARIGEIFEMLLENPLPGGSDGNCARTYAVSPSEIT